MKRKAFIVLVFLSIITPLLADDTANVAVVEFQNRSKGAIRFNGPEMAVWMAKELKETGNFKICDRKKVQSILKDATWDGERLSAADEARIKELPAQYIVYGSLVNWQESFNTKTPNPYATGRFKDATVPAAVVVIGIELVDLESGKAVKTFTVDGVAQKPTVGMGSPEGSSRIDLELRDQLFEEATQNALRRAAAMIDE